MHSDTFIIKPTEGGNFVLLYVFTLYHHVLQRETALCLFMKGTKIDRGGKDHLVSSNRFTGLVKKLTYYTL